MLTKSDVMGKSEKLLLPPQHRKKGGRLLSQWNATTYKSLKNRAFRDLNISEIVSIVFHCSKHPCTDEDLQNKMHYVACWKSTTMF